MAFRDRVMETTTSTGAGNLTLAGAVAGYRSFNAAFGLNKLFEVCIEAVDPAGVPSGDWEVCSAYLSATTTLVKDRFLDSSTGSTITFTTGTKRVFCVVPAQEIRTTGLFNAGMRGMDMP